MLRHPCLQPPVFHVFQGPPLCLARSTYKLTYFSPNHHRPFLRFGLLSFKGYKQAISCHGLGFMETIPSPWLGFLRGVFPVNYLASNDNLTRTTKRQNISSITVLFKKCCIKPQTPHHPGMSQASVYQLLPAEVAAAARTASTSEQRSAWTKLPTPVPDRRPCTIPKKLAAKPAKEPVLFKLTVTVTEKVK